jgi:hypothetical protein
MWTNKDAELTSAVLRYAVRCVNDGDQAALRRMNFGPKEVKALREMNLADLDYIDRFRAQCLNIELDREVYWPMISQLKARRESEELQKALIMADAPQEMMTSFFGMSGREYARLRRILMVETVIGRPREPTQDDLEKLWSVWKNHLAAGENTFLPPETYLAVSQESGVSLRAIWSQTRRWEAYGQLSIDKQAG